MGVVERRDGMEGGRFELRVFFFSFFSFWEVGVGRVEVEVEGEEMGLAFRTRREADRKAGRGRR